MKIRRYKGPSREALYQAIRDEMGPDAVVVAPEYVPGSLFGRGRHELIAIAEDAPVAAGDVPVADTAIRPDQADQGPSSTAEGSDDFRRWRRMQARQWKDLQRALSDIRQTVSGLQRAREGGGDSAAASWPVDPDVVRAWDARFVADLRHRLPATGRFGTDAVAQALADELPVARPFVFRRADRCPHTIVLVGPTGAGKTTTLAKMAAIAALQQRLRVGIITIDTYRVAAVDQIREYATLLDLPLRVVFSADEARTAVKALEACDVILVDTPGRAHSDEMGLAISRKVLAGLAPMTVLLTIPATLNPADLPDVLNGFGRFSPDALVVTKVDETRRPVMLTALPYESDLRVAFVTDGQRVPQDIFAASADRLAALLMTVEPDSSRLGDVLMPEAMEDRPAVVGSGRPDHDVSRPDKVLLLKKVMSQKNRL